MDNISSLVDTQRYEYTLELRPDRSSTFYVNQEKAVLQICDKLYRLTPFIVTLCDGELTILDIQKFIEMGLNIVRFQMYRITIADKLKLLALLNKAVKWCCEKYDVSTWPVAISVDIPNACIRTGFLKNKNVSHIYLKEDSIVEITTNTAYANQCDETRIFIDDPYTIKLLKLGTEISLRFGFIVMTCVEKVNDATVKCKVIRGGKVTNMEFVCIRGVKHARPPLTDKDLELIAFAKELKLDIVTVYSVRRVSTVRKVKALLGDNRPKILSTICEQEGLDNIDEIIEESDGIILAREFLANEIVNKHQMLSIQLQISAKCRQYGKPFFISAILEDTLISGSLSSVDISDITNAVLNGSGFLLRNYSDPANLQKAIAILDSICRSVEPLVWENDFWRLFLEFKVPTNAAEACVLSCALAARQSGALIVIVLTVSGKSAVMLTRIAPEAIILTISSNATVAKHLLLYRGIIPIVYDKKMKNNWHDEMAARVRFGVSYGLKYGLLRYGHKYVALQKSSPTSAYCDHVSIWTVMTEEQIKHVRKQNIFDDNDDD